MSVLQIICELYGRKKPLRKRTVQLETGDPDIDDFQPSPPKTAKSGPAVEVAAVEEHESPAQPQPIPAADTNPVTSEDGHLHHDPPPPVLSLNLGEHVETGSATPSTAPDPATSATSFSSKLTPFLNNVVSDNDFTGWGARVLHSHWSRNVEAGLFSLLGALDARAGSLWHKRADVNNSSEVSSTSRWTSLLENKWLLLI